MRTLACDTAWFVTNPETFGAIITAICNQNEPGLGDAGINVIIILRPPWGGGKFSVPLGDVLRIWQLFIVLFISPALSVVRSGR